MVASSEVQGLGAFVLSPKVASLHQPLTRFRSSRGNEAV